MATKKQKEARQHRVRRVQRGINRLSHRSGLDLRRLRVDGDKGSATRHEIKQAQWLLGFGRKNINAKITPEFLWQLEHPRRVKTVRPQFKEKHPEQAQRIINCRKLRRNRGIKRRIIRRHWVARNRTRAFFATGVGTFEARPVAKWMIPKLEWARRQSHAWGLTSGYRTPAYSEHLCYVMCGHPTCPGKCAGRATNHAHADPLPPPVNGAIDVWGYVTFGQLMARADCPGPRIFNALPIDRVHFSPSGR